MYNTFINLNDENKKFINKYPIIFKKFRVLNHLSKGAFSDIYTGINIITKEKVAIKVEERFKIEKFLEAECYFIFSLKNIGIPKVISFGHNKEYDILVMPLLGKSLHEMQINENYNFEFKDICLIAIQVIERIQWVHSQKIIHRDIKPDNFLIGLNDPNILYLIDFGLSKKYRSSVTGNHIKYNKVKKFVGSLRYASVNALKLREQSRRDDLESIGYMLIFLIKGSLPWDNIKVENKRSSFYKISQFKQKLEPEILCRNLPKEFAEYIRYVKNLNFEEEPDYNYLKSLFQNLLRKQGFEEEKIFFSWINEFNINQIKKSINLSKRNSSSRGRILNQLRKLIENRRSKSELQKDMDEKNTNFNEKNNNKYPYNLIKNKNKNFMNENDEDINYQNYENKLIINNYINSYISPKNNNHLINKLYQNQYQFNITAYNPLILKPNENKKNTKPILNIKYLGANINQNKFKYNYTPNITNNNNENYEYKAKNNIKNSNENNKYINVINNNNFYGEYNLLNKSYPNKIAKKYYINQENKQNNNIIKVPLSCLNANANMKNKNIINKKPNVIQRIKNFNLLNISPFKKRNNNIQKNKNNNRIKTDNNIVKQNQLMDELKRFNNKYNINLGKNDKTLIRNKIKKFRMSKIMMTNKSADNNKFNQLKNKYKYNGNNTDKNCIII